MESWRVPDLAPVGGSPVPLRLFDSATQQVRPVAPGRDVAMYVCGITPYDSTHLGHAATYLTFDLVNRVLRDNGCEVGYVQNVTDVDDPLLERAQRDGEAWRDLARREVQQFRDDMAALDVLPPDTLRSVTEAMPLIIDLVRCLEERGASYVLEGDRYFAVRTATRLGQVSALGPEAMAERFAGHGGDPNRPGKQHPLDALIWRSARPGEPSWDSPMGPGRPGWHVQCAALALHGHGMGFDIQGGGRDLTFPHHDLTAALAEVATGGWPFARHYVHTGMIGYEGQRMSKSRGNLVLASQLLAAAEEPAAIRLALLDTRYRRDRMWTAQRLERARARLTLWRLGLQRARGPEPAAVINDVRRALADDLDTPRALHLLDAWAADAVAGLGAGATAEVGDAVRALLGVRV